MYWNLPTFQQFWQLSILTHFTFSAVAPKLLDPQHTAHLLIGFESKKILRYGLPMYFLCTRSNVRLKLDSLVLLQRRKYFFEGNVWAYLIILLPQCNVKILTTIRPNKTQKIRPTPIFHPEPNFTSYYTTTSQCRQFVLKMYLHYCTVFDFRWAPLWFFFLQQKHAEMVFTTVRPEPWADCRIQD